MKTKALSSFDQLVLATLVETGKLLRPRSFEHKSWALRHSRWSRKKHWDRDGFEIMACIFLSASR